MKNKIFDYLLSIYQRLHLIDWLVLLATLVFSCWLMMSTFGYKDGQIWMDSKLYSDFGAHLPLIRSFSRGWNFPPEYPFFAGEPIRYHYFFYLLVGVLERIGLRIDWALNIPSIIGMWLLLLMIYKITVLFFKSRLAGGLALLLFLLNGSLSFVEYFNLHTWSVESLLAIPEQTSFASFGPWSGRLVSAFWNLNIYTNQRHLSLSFGLVLLALYPLLVSVSNLKQSKVKLKPFTRLKKIFVKYLSCFRSFLFQTKLKPMKRSYLLLMMLGLVVLFGVMPILHQAGYVILLYLSVLFLVFYPTAVDKRLQVIYILGILISFASFWGLTAGSNQPVRLEFGYLATDKTVSGLLSYWWYNLGIYLPLLPALLVYSLRLKNYFLLFVSGLFVLANIVRLSPDMINNHKLLNFFMIGVVIFTAGLLSSWLKRTASHRFVAILILPCLIFSGFIDLFPIINDYAGGVDDVKKSAIQAWVLNNTPVDSQFLTSSYMYSPASLVGRQIYLDYGYHAWSMGYDDRHKRQLLSKLWSPNIAKRAWCSLMISEKLDFVIIGPGETAVEDGRIDIVNSSVVSKFAPIYSEPGGWRVWSVEQICK